MIFEGGFLKTLRKPACIITALAAFLFVFHPLVHLDEHEECQECLVCHYLADPEGIEVSYEFPQQFILVSNQLLTYVENDTSPIILECPDQRGPPVA